MISVSQKHNRDHSAVQTDASAGLFRGTSPMAAFTDRECRWHEGQIPNREITAFVSHFSYCSVTKSRKQVVLKIGAIHQIAVAAVRDPLYRGLFVCDLNIDNQFIYEASH